MRVSIDLCAWPQSPSESSTERSYFNVVLCSRRRLGLSRAPLEEGPARSEAKKPSLLANADDSTIADGGGGSNLASNISLNSDRAQR